MKSLWNSLVFNVGVWCMTRAFPYLSVYAPGDDGDDNNVKAIIFAHDVETLERYATRAEMRGL